jgi:asparagine synthase (glutamine-hydrolysing)
MCGIFFMVNQVADDTYVESEFLKGKSRGPDESKFIKIKNVYLGFHRLAINGLDSSGMQPFIKNNCYLICNGEIYNHKILYSHLDILPTSGSDCEIILDLYLKYGIEYTCRILDGVFAFILVDLNKDFIYFGRDPFGVRPLFYYNAITSFGAASELKTIQHFNYKILQFPPGHYSKISKNGMSTYRYFNINSINTICYLQNFDNYETYKIIVNNMLIHSVKKRLMTDRPIACLLSGGLDSSLITSIVSKIVNYPVRTYSIGLAGSPDLRYARQVAEYLNTEHSEIIVSEDDFFNAIPEVIKTIESYDTTTVRASVGNYLIAKHISLNSDSKVIFNGDGADELCGGYLYFHNSPSKLDSDYETIRLLQNIHYFDVLRSDKSISSCGLEPRTPFLDKSFVSAYRSIPLEYRFQGGQIEKKLLRDSFVGYLPDEVLYRRKEAFSDGVSDSSRSWYQIIQEKLSSFNIPNIKDKLIFNVPCTKEQEYYRIIFEREFPYHSGVIPYFWMPKWSNTQDPSARTLTFNSE